MNRSDAVNTPKRPYRAPAREAAAAQTREAILAAAKDVFERRGWSGATMRGIAARAGVSVKTVEALHRTKAALLKEVVDYAVAGDTEPVPILGRDPVKAMEAAPDAPSMLDLHARHVRGISGRAAAIFHVAEQAASAHEDVARLWEQMCNNRRHGMQWAATTLRAKPDVPTHVGQSYAEEVFWIASDPSTYRSLTLGRGHDAVGFEAWIRNYYDRMLLR